MPFGRVGRLPFGRICRLLFGRVGRLPSGRVGMLPFGRFSRLLFGRVGRGWWGGGGVGWGWWGGGVGWCPRLFCCRYLLSLDGHSPFWGWFCRLLHVFRWVRLVWYVYQSSAVYEFALVAMVTFSFGEEPAVDLDFSGFYGGSVGVGCHLPLFVVLILGFTGHLVQQLDHFGYVLVRSLDGEGTSVQVIIPCVDHHVVEGLYPPDTFSSLAYDFCCRVAGGGDHVCHYIIILGVGFLVSHCEGNLQVFSGGWRHQMETFSA